MAKTITVDPVALMHSGGTKFYEILMFSDPLANKFVEVRRWGKIEAIHTGGGQVSITEHTTDWALRRSTKKQQLAKEKGGYRAEKSIHAFHSNAGEHAPTALRIRLAQHYNDPATRASIVAKLALEDIHSALDAELTPKREEAPVDRGEHWGSW